MTVSRRIVSTPAGPMRVVEAVPASAPRGAVVVLHQAGGLSQQIDRTAAYLADAGFWAIGPDLFHRKNLPEDFDAGTYFPNGMDDISPWLEGDADILEDLDVVLQLFADGGVQSDAVGVLGFSYGGRAAFLAATERPIGAAVSFYGPGIRWKGFEPNPLLPVLMKDGTRLRAPWSGFFGERDPLTTPAELDEITAWAGRSGLPARVVRYAEAGHAFDVDFGPEPPPGCIYLPETARSAFREARQWFSVSLRGPHDSLPTHL